MHKILTFIPLIVIWIISAPLNYLLDILDALLERKIFNSVNNANNFSRPIKSKLSHLIPYIIFGIPFNIIKNIVQSIFLIYYIIFPNIMFLILRPYINKNLHNFYNIKDDIEDINELDTILILKKFRLMISGIYNKFAYISYRDNLVLYSKTNKKYKFIVYLLKLSIMPYITIFPSSNVYNRFNNVRNINALFLANNKFNMNDDIVKGVLNEYANKLKNNDKTNINTYITKYM